MVQIKMDGSSEYLHVYKSNKKNFIMIMILTLSNVLCDGLGSFIIFEAICGENVTFVKCQ